MADLKLLRKCWRWRCPSFALAFAAWPHGIWRLQLSWWANPNIVVRYIFRGEYHLRRFKRTSRTGLKVVQKMCWSSQNSWGKVRHHHCKNVLSPSATYALGNSESWWDQSPLWMPGGWWNPSWIASRKVITISRWTLGIPLPPTEGDKM